MTNNTSIKWGKNSTLLLVSLIVSTMVACGNRTTKQAQNPLNENTESSTLVFDKESHDFGTIDEQAQNPQSENTESSTLVFDKESHDFGTIDEVDGVVTALFKFTNKGSNAIVIEGVMMSCGCTKVDYPRKTIEPGKGGEIKVMYDPKNRPGAINSTVMIDSNFGKNENKLRLRGTVMPRPLTVEDEYPLASLDGFRLDRSSINFSRVDKGKDYSTKISCVNSGKREITLDFQKENDPEGIFIITSPKTLRPNERIDVLVECSPTIAGDIYGSVQATIRPVVNGAPDQNRSITLKAIVVDSFDDVKGDKTPSPRSEIDESIKRIGTIKKGEQKSVEFTLTNNGTAELIVRAVEVSIGIFTDLGVGVVVKPNNNTIFRVGVDSNEYKTGLHSGYVTIISNDPHKPIRKLRVSGQITQ